MGKLTSAQKKSMYDEMLANITADISSYYAFGSNPVPIDGGDAEPLQTNDFEMFQNPDYRMIFGKKLNNLNFMPVINKVMWQSGTVYTPYDNKKNISSSLFYVISIPQIMGGDYKVFKCIDNNNGAASTIDPGSISIQQQTVRTSDGYKWRYLTSISSTDFVKFSTTFYSPITSNATIQNSASELSKLEKIVVTNTGSGYLSYHSGKLGGYINSTALFLDSNASSNSGFYTNNSIYVYDTSNNYQLFRITNHYPSLDKKVVIIDSPANVSIISSSGVSYIISPTVKIDSDSPLTDLPTAYSVINATSNSISSIIVLNGGSKISRANVSISSNFGSGASCYAIVPPPGGHGYNPPVELNMVGFCINFSFSNSEVSTIPTNVTYNKVGILKNPYYIDGNTYYKSVNTYKSATFNQLLSGNVSYSFTVGDIVYGSNSNAKAIVAWANTSYVSLVGDYNFINGESLNNSNGASLSTITIQNRPDVFTKDITPIYINNINNINRSNTQTETHKLIIKI